ncbi:MAG: cytochrome c [Acidobacteriota bacterium]|nr:cytochrome c [Acidobacteriota bacterium]
MKYLLALTLIGLAGIAALGEEPLGKAAFLRVCADCHGGQGQGDIAPPIVPLAYDADYVLLIVREGYIEMPPISTREITDEEIREVVAYLETITPEPPPESDEPPES